MNLARRVIRRKPSSSTTAVAATLVAGAAAVDAADVDCGLARFRVASGSGGRREEGAECCDPCDEGREGARELASLLSPLGGLELYLGMRPASTASLS